MADRISYAAVIGRAISSTETNCEEHDIPPCLPCATDIAALRELAALCERAEKVAEISMSPLLLALAAGFDPQRAGAREER